MLIFFCCLLRAKALKEGYEGETEGVEKEGEEAIVVGLGAVDVLMSSTRRDSCSSALSQKDAWPGGPGDSQSGRGR